MMAWAVVMVVVRVVGDGWAVAAINAINGCWVLRGGWWVGRCNGAAAAIMANGCCLFVPAMGRDELWAVRLAGGVGCLAIVVGGSGRVVVAIWRVVLPATGDGIAAIIGGGSDAEIRMLRSGDERCVDVAPGRQWGCAGGGWWAVAAAVAACAGGLCVGCCCCARGRAGWPGGRQVFDGDGGMVVR